MLIFYVLYDIYDISREVVPLGLLDNNIIIYITHVQYRTGTPFTEYYNIFISFI